jgi:hypothetical protein
MYFLRRKGIHNESMNRKRHFVDLLRPHRRDEDRLFPDHDRSPKDGQVTEAADE